MTNQLPPATSSSDNKYATTNLGVQGQDYARLLAIRLLTRSTFDQRPFRLAIECNAADKFDDVAFFDERNEEWWFFQVKHTTNEGNVTREAMLPDKPSKGDFEMFKYFKSFLRIHHNWPYGGKTIRLFLFTNWHLDASVQSTNVEVDEMLKFSGGKHSRIQHKPEYTKIFLNHIDNEICDCLVKLFKKRDDRAIKSLWHLCAPILAQVLDKNEDKLKFNHSFLASNSNLYKILKDAFTSEDMKKLTIKVKNFPEFRSDNHDNNFTTFIEGRVNEFFQVLVLSSSQPNTKSLAKEIQHDWIRWMKQCIRPDVFRKMTRDQLKEPFNTFKTGFDKWEDVYRKPKERQFLTHAKGKMFLEEVDEKLGSYVKLYGRKGYVGLDAAEKYYVNRRVTFGKRQKRSEELSDEKFVDWIHNTWNDQQCIAIFAEPGMGKSTLWQHLAFQAQKKDTDVEVFLIYLNELKDELTYISSDATPTTAVEIMSSEISDENMRLLLDRKKPVIMFLDAFDELRGDNMKPILNFINLFMKSNTDAKSSDNSRIDESKTEENSTNVDKEKARVKFLISSRELYQRKLEQHLSLRMIDVMPFDDGDRRSFLRLFWKAEDSEAFNEFSTLLLRNFESGVPRADIGFIGLPLTIKMLAEVFHGMFSEYKVTPDIIKAMLSKVSIDIIFLYEQFTSKCISLTLNKQWKLDIDNKDKFENRFNSVITKAKYNFQLFAMTQIDLNDMIAESDESKLEEFRSKFDNGQEESVLLETSTTGPRFLHKSYAEYLSATYLYGLGTGNGANSKNIFAHIVRKIFVCGSSTANGANGANLEDIFKNAPVVRKFYLKRLEKDFNHQYGIEKRQEIVKHMPSMIKVWACEDNCGKLLSDAIDGRGALDINYDGIHTTLLHIAAKSNSCDAMRALLNSAVEFNIDIENESQETPLLLACVEGHMEMVVLLVETAKANVNHRKGEWETILYRAALRGHHKIVDFLISKGADTNPPSNVAAFKILKDRNWYSEEMQSSIEKGLLVNIVDSNGKTALHIAVQRKEMTILEELIQCGASVNILDPQNETPVHYAARHKDSKILTLLLQTESFSNSNQSTALHMAVKDDDEVLCEKLLSCGAVPDPRDEEGKTPLFHACNGSPLESIVKILIKYGANVNAHDDTKNAPLHYAARAGHSDAIKLLDDVGADRDNKNSHHQTALHVAVLKGVPHIAQILLERGANVNAQDHEWNTPLHYAAREGHLEVLRLLVDGGANINASNRSSNTPLHLAAQDGRTEIGRNLLVEGADVHACDIEANTPLHYAAREGHLEVLRLLVDGGANINASNRSSNTPLHLAAQDGQTEIGRYLINGGANGNAEDHEGNTPLHYAARAGHSDVLLLFLRNGADVNALNNSSKTALHLAAHDGRTEIVKQLLTYGANPTLRDDDGKSPLDYATVAEVRQLLSN